MASGTGSRAISPEWLLEDSVCLVSLLVGHIGQAGGLDCPQPQPSQQPQYSLQVDRHQSHVRLYPEVRDTAVPGET